MHYLKLTIQRNRRRIQLEQLLLLLLRIALPVLLFFFLARPVINPTGLEQWLGTGGRSSQVVLIDDSMSMGYTAGEAPAFQRALQAAAGLLASIRPQDHCTVVTTSAPRAPVIHDVEGSRRDEISAAVASVPLDRHARRLAGGARGRRRGLAVVHLSHAAAHDPDRLAQERAGSAASQAISRRWSEQGVRVRIVDVGSDEAANVVAPGARCRPIARSWPVPRVGLGGVDPQRLAAHAHRRQGDPPRRRQADRGGAAGDRASSRRSRVPLVGPVPGSGPHELSLQLPDDELPGDNHALGRRAGERLAADPPGGRRAVVGAVRLRGRLPRRSLVDRDRRGRGLARRGRAGSGFPVAAPGPRRRARPGQRRRPDARAGRAPGPPGQGRHGPHDLHRARSSTSASTTTCFYRADDRLLPFPLKSLVDESIRGLFVEPLRPSPLEKLLELKPSALERVAVRQIMTVDEQDDKDQVRVLARWNNPGRSPAVVERVVGDGRVLLWTTTADRAGNDWPIEPSFVLAVREAVRGSARPTRFDNTVTAGERMRRVVHSSQPVSNARLTPPGGGEPRSLPVVPLGEEPGDHGPAVAINVPDTRRPGLYRLAWDEGSARHAARSVRGQSRSARERARADRRAELKSMLEPLDVEIATARGDGADLFAATGREIWRDLARRAARSADRRVDLRNLGRPLALTPSRSNRRP